MSVKAPVQQPRTTAGAQRPDAWEQRAVIAGFIATAVFSMVGILAYSIARAAGRSDHSANLLGQWLYGLSHNVIVTEARDGLYAALLLNVVVGIIWAAIYAGFAEPRLHGPAWQKGLTFAVLPCMLSIVVLFPVLHAGLFGTDLGGGPLPVLGNIVLHMAYGVTLGTIYALDSFGAADANGHELSANNAAERGAALGFVGGAIVGGLGGMALGLLSKASTDTAIATGPFQTFFFGTVLGAVAGLLLGSMRGIGQLSEGGGRGEPRP